MRVLLLACALWFSFSATAWAVPEVGRAVPAFSVEDLSGRVRTPRDLAGRYTVVLAMSDKDAASAVRAWWFRAAAVAPPGTRIVTMAALDLFAMIPTATIVAEARSSTPRERWTEVWLSRDGSLAESLGLPDSETPWVFVLDPWGRVIERVHAAASDAAVSRVAAALQRNAPRAAAR